MNDLRKDFIRQTAAELETLSAKIRNENLSNELFSEIFRKIHSVKGTAQVFDLANAAAFAHALETALAAEQSKDFLQNALKFLAQSLGDENFQIPASFAEKIKNFQTVKAEKVSYLSKNFPAEFTAELSESEKARLNSFLQKDFSPIVLEIGFDLANFVEAFKEFRQNLEKKGEIIATLPSPRFSAEGKVGFRIIFATRQNTGEIIKNSAARIVFQTNEKSANELEKTVNQIVRHGKDLAEKFTKNIEFSIKVEAEISSPATLKLIFEILLHLVRNAVDHAFDKHGKVEIRVETKENKIFLSVADNGKGLDPARIRKKAIEKKLIAESEILPDEEIQNLIFAPAFSTAENVSEVSGRGIGLDAVKNLVENAGGEISVKSAAGKGAAFDVFLPKEL